MWGAILRATGPAPLDVRDDLELIGAAGPGEVQLRVHATGLCHSDLSARHGTMPVSLPAVLGHEAAGEIVAVGTGVTHVAPGDNVVVAAVPPCGRCSFCLRGSAYLCVNFAAMFSTPPRYRCDG